MQLCFLSDGFMFVGVPSEFTNSLILYFRLSHYSQNCGTVELSNFLQIPGVPVPADFSYEPV